MQKQTALSLGLNIAAQKTYTLVVGTSTGALKAFRIALAATGIGLAVLAIAALVQNWDKLKAAINGTNSALEDNISLQDKQIEAAEKRLQMLDIEEKKMKLLGATERELLKIREYRTAQALGEVEVHRIDKDTSGIIVLAKNEYALSFLAKQFFDRKTKRLYWAFVWGNLAEDSGTIRGHIGRHQKNRMQMAVYEDGSQGKHAVTHYKVLERFKYMTWVECKLETGRTHH